jgi:peptidoglycan hydrolase-like protein with peptidoglycan-binding domain
VTQLDSPAVNSGRGKRGDRGKARSSRLARQRRALLGVGVGAALLAVGGLIGASLVKSPQQLAADTAAPPPTVTTEPVVSQVVTSSVQMRGVVYPSVQYDVYVSAADSSAAGSSSTGPMYISKLEVAAGGTIRNGKQLAELDGEPLFALAGQVPAWRDLTPGESGPDVMELQHALATLGYYHDGDTAGYFGSATQAAVAAYYEHLGYAAPTSGGVPAADVIFLPSLPASVVAVNGATGQQPGQPFLELAARGSLTLTGELPPAYAGQVKAGLRVSIYSEVTGTRATGTVAQLGTATTTVPAGTVVNIGTPSSGSESSGSGSGSGSGGSGGSEAPTFIPLTVDPSAPLAAALNGQNVLVTVQTGQTEGPVLTVPVAAIVTSAAGTSYVTVTGAKGGQTQVAVTPGLSQNGYVQVTPARAGTLAAGDRVVVSG